MKTARAVTGTAMNNGVFCIKRVYAYTLFMQNTPLFIAVPVTALAVFIPYSGYVIIFLYFMFNSAVKTYVGEI